ncbi:recombinase family protein [Corallococcus sp. AS-1-12]|uniref:recombinase family protein n=1 Tax=Corallococcus sp. AS-1-12 TaxID=2874598 RepID=UPI001CBAFE26|nr:recombinase family protein [Corallococcus sp. AS-1-12]MBZ4336728.1 recombinase family protein [Corallococcus sp. AS-1-12]
MNHTELPEALLKRRAVVYVRQSTSAQVQDNLESQRRQYGLAELARTYGFREVVTIDDDLGRSASGMVARPGFDALVAQICQGEVGAVFCLEASRLARNGREWHHLLELCGLVGARVVDSDGAYDPSVPNDRLLLGLKGTLSEFELTLMRRRLVEGAQAKARRGEYRLGVPVGYRWEHKTVPEMEPDRRVQEAIRTVFRLFERFESARQVHQHMCREGVLFPRPGDGKRAGAPYRWETPAYRNIISVLQNPFYAGAYAYGKSTARTTLVEGRLTKSYGHALPMERWAVLLREHHAGYIRWVDFERNQERLRRNAHRRPAGSAKAGRGGQALLAGLLRCRRCGRMLFVLYAGLAPRRPRYACRRGHENHGTAPCISFGASTPDELMANEVLQAVAPVAVEATITAMNLAQQQHAEHRRALELETEQARYEARLAQRRYEAVDPDNRLVAAELEARWNTALAQLSACKQRLTESGKSPVDVPYEEELLRLAENLRAAWHSPRADAAIKQRLVRALVQEIVVDVDEATREVVLVIHWRGGQHSEVRARKPASGEHRRRASAAADTLIREKAGRQSDEEIAAALNRDGHRTGHGHPWTERRVASYRRTARICGYAPARGDGDWLTMRDAAAALGVPSQVIRGLIQRGVLPAQQVMSDAPWQIRTKDLQAPTVRKAIRTRRTSSRAAPKNCRRGGRKPTTSRRGDAQ